MKSVKEYIANPFACPVCNSDDIRGGYVDIEGRSAYQTVQCEACGAEWEDQYTLDNYVLIEGGDA